ncbi:PREDICTED: regulator of G-protein signaling 18 isoform X3 [Cercocebus atys]|uniref:regulator of G-protein signaling 18 isoform X3 n=1 Tax=Cercocebus atys TaxID=9531 RepID=UPI0005F4702B|nr:PREDICTED: regulator of G-protein signaling 18 isoform X3 [Cercocebus atys]
METTLLFFSQINMCESKEKTFFKLIHGSGKEETSKEAKIRAKEKRNRLSLLVQKPEFHEDTCSSRSGHLAKDTRVSPEEAVKWGESFDKLLSHRDSSPVRDGENKTKQQKQIGLGLISL